MFSKQTRCAALSLITLLSVSCGMRFDANKDEGKKLPVGTQTGCLNGAKVTLTRFLEGAGNAAEVDRFWDCASTALRIFPDYVEGDQRGVYQPQELRRFLQKFFLTDFEVTDELLKRAMELKQWVVGGSVREVTFEDLENTQKFISTLKNVSLQLLPYMPLTPTYFFDSTDSIPSRLSEERLASALDAFERATSDLIAVFERSPVRYSLAQLHGLLVEISKIPGYRPDGPLALVIKELPLLRSLKLGIVGGPSGFADPVPSKDWGRLLRVAVQGYKLFLRLDFLAENYPLRSYPESLTGGARDRYVAWVLDSLRQFDLILLRREGQVFPYTALHELIAQLPWKKDLGLETASVLKFVEVINEKVFKSGSKVGITSKSIATFRAAFNEWNRGQRLLEPTFKIPDPRDLVADSGTYKERLPDDPGAPTWSFTPFNGAYFASTPPDVSEYLGRPWPFFGDGNLETVFEGFRPGRLVKYTHSFSGLSHLNWMNQLGSLLIRGYAKPGATTVSLEEFKVFYEDVRDIGLQLQLLDPDDRKAPVGSRVPNKRTREANLFLPSSDGDGMLSQREGVELLGHMLSTKSLSTRIHLDLISASVCGAAGPIDLFGKVSVPAECFRKHFFWRFKDYFTQWPVLTEYYVNLSSDERAQFAKMLEVVGRKYPEQWTSPISSGDIEAMIGALQYIESVFQRFDRNSDGIINDFEAEQAFGIFKKTLVEVVNKLQPGTSPDEKDLRILFRFLLATGKKPEGKAEIFWWSLGGKVEASRLRLISIFALLVQAP